MWVEVLCWIDRVCPIERLDTPSIWFVCFECAWCACDPSVHLRVPSLCFVFVCWKLSSHLGA